MSDINIAALRTFYIHQMGKVPLKKRQLQSIISEYEAIQRVYSLYYCYKCPIVYSDYMLKSLVERKLYLSESTLQMTVDEIYYGYVFKDQDGESELRQQ